MVLKTNAENGCPPCNDYFRLAHFEHANIVYFSEISLSVFPGNSEG
jgi:hypothetical protein